MLKKFFTTSLLGMLFCTSLVIGSDHSNSSEPNWGEVSADVTARSKRSHGKRCRCRPPLPKTNAADGVRLNYCDSPESSIYQREYKFLRPFIPTLTTLTQNVVDQASYQLLLDECNAIVSGYNAKFGVTSGRMLIADADGLVVVDTSKSNNTFANAEAGANPSTFASAINVNHNSRIVILDAQQYFAGVGVATRFSNSVKAFQIYVAIRLGPILHNSGTARISQNAQ